MGELPWPLHPLQAVTVTWRAQHNMEDKGQPSRLHSEAPMAGSLGPPFVVPRANLAFALLQVMHGLRVSEAVTARAGPF